MPTKPIDYIRQLGGKLCRHCLAGFMDEQYNTRVTCGWGNIVLNVGIPCTEEDWGRCPLNDGSVKVQSRRYRKTIYDTVPVQIYLMHNVKAPLMEAARDLLSGRGVKTSFKAVLQIYRAVKAVKKLPEPTSSNVNRPSALNLILIRDKFFRRCGLNVLRNGFIRTFFNFIIILLQMDGPWRMMIIWVKKEVEKLDWEEEGDDINQFKWWSKADED